MKPLKNNTGLWLLFIALLATAVAAVFLGPVHNPDLQIILKVRLPRVLAGLMAGASLAGAGALMQGVLRNPLADPYILGTSSGAALGAACSLMLGSGFGTPLFYILSIFGAFAATTASYFLARADNRAPAINLLLSGIIVSTFCGALILLFFSLRREDSFSVLMFMMGSITESSPSILCGAAVLFIIGAATGILLSRQIDLMTLGEEKAQTLGVPAEKMKFMAFACGALMCAAAVMLSGTIGFVGLIVPHICRLILGPAQRRLMLGSVMAGALFLTAMDALARTAAAPAEIPVGVLTALAGAPFFLWLLKKRGTGYGL
jgi:iron complex transport system permease protein